MFVQNNFYRLFVKPFCWPIFGNNQLSREKLFENENWAKLGEHFEHKKNQITLVI